MSRNLRGHPITITKWRVLTFTRQQSFSGWVINNSISICSRNLGQDKVDGNDLNALMNNLRSEWQLVNIISNFLLLIHTHENKHIQCAQAKHVIDHCLKLSLGCSNNSNRHINPIVWVWIKHSTVADSAIVLAKKQMMLFWVWKHHPETIRQYQENQPL